MIDRLLLAKIPLAGIARVMQLSEDWLQGDVNECYDAVPPQVQVQPKAKATRSSNGRVVVVCRQQGKQAPVWLALDVATREIVGCDVADRSSEAAMAVWKSLPPVDRQCAIVYTDYWQAYATVLPSKRHPCSGQGKWIDQYH